MMEGRSLLWDILETAALDQPTKDYLFPLAGGSPVDCYVLGMSFIYEHRDTMPDVLLQWAIAAADLVMEHNFHGKSDLAAQVILAFPLAEPEPEAEPDPEPLP